MKIMSLTLIGLILIPTGTQGESPIFVTTQLSENDGVIGRWGDRGKFSQITDNVKMLSPQGIAIKQTQQILKVTVPELGTISLRNGDSFTGKLTAFNAQNLTLSVGDYSQSFPLKEINKIDFSLDDVWIEIEGGRRERLRIRGITIPVDNIPLSGFTLDNSKIKGKINLNHLPLDQFEKLTKDPNKIKVIQTIILEKNQTLTIKIVNSK